MSAIPATTREYELGLQVEMLSDQLAAARSDLAHLRAAMRMSEATRNRLVEEMCECIACSRRRARGEA